MEQMLIFLGKLHKEESGAAFIEYTVLLGVILVVSIGVIGAIGTWANGEWSLLNSSVNP